MADPSDKGILKLLESSKKKVKLPAQSYTDFIEKFRNYLKQRGYSKVNGNTPPRPYDESVH